MTGYAFSFFVVALITGFFGFHQGVTGLASEIAKILCMAFGILTVLSFTVGTHGTMGTYHHHHRHHRPRFR